MSQVDSVVEAYRAAVKYAAPGSAHIISPNGDSYLVTSSWSQRNLETEKMTKFQLTHILDASLHKTAELFPIDTASEVISAVSPSSLLRAVVREVTGSSGPKKQFLEVWRQGLLWLNFDLSALDVHGDVYTDGEFGSLEWSPCEQKLVYVAEEKVPKSEPFYKVKPQEKKEADSKTNKGEEHAYRQDWGEQLTGKHHPVVVVCDTSAPSCPLSVLQGIPDNLCPGQVCWAPRSSGVVGVAWDTQPRRLGLIYCSNRRSALFHLTFDGVFTVLTEDGLAVRSPRFSPDGQTLVWLQRRAGGAHHGALSLQRSSWDSSRQAQAEVVIAQERQHSLTTNGKQFYGLYNQQLPRRCWAQDSRRILLSTPQKYCVNLYIVDTGSGSVTELGLPEADLTVLDVGADVVVCAHSSFKSPPSLWVGRLPPTGQELELKWSVLTSSTPPTGLDKLELHYLELEQDTSASCKNFNAMYFGPGSVDGRVPLVVWPHGGPHSSFSSNYKMEAAFLGTLGFGMLFVNYRGSTGMGQDCVEFLLGNVGCTDVSDVHLAAKEVLVRLPHLDPDRVVLMGGSHGGFLVTHLSGQHPLFYKAVVARNPVIDVAAMFSISDIPDWSVVEAGFEHPLSSDVSMEVYKKMKAASPIVHVQKVVAPTLLLLGKNDLRVPCSQGLGYYHLLRANNTTARVLLYDDCHPLGQAAVEIDNIINAALWFREHLDLAS